MSITKRQLLKESESVIIPFEILIETLTVLLYKENVEFVKDVYELLEATETFIIYYEIFNLNYRTCIVANTSALSEWIDKETFWN